MNRFITVLLTGLYLSSVSASTQMLISKQQGSNFVIVEQVKKKPRYQRIKLKVKTTNETSKKTN